MPKIPQLETRNFLTGCYRLGAISYYSAGFQAPLSQAIVERVAQGKLDLDKTYETLRRPEIRRKLAAASRYLTPKKAEKETPKSRSDDLQPVAPQAVTVAAKEVAEVLPMEDQEPVLRKGAEDDVSLSFEVVSGQPGMPQVVFHQEPVNIVASISMGQGVEALLASAFPSLRERSAEVKTQMGLERPLLIGLVRPAEKEAQTVPTIFGERSIRQLISYGQKVIEVEQAVRSQDDVSVYSVLSGTMEAEELKVIEQVFVKQGSAAVRPLLSVIDKTERSIGGASGRVEAIVMALVKTEARLSLEEQKAVAVLAELFLEKNSGFWETVGRIVGLARKPNGADLIIRKALEAAKPAAVYHLVSQVEASFNNSRIGRAVKKVASALTVLRFAVLAAFLGIINLIMKLLAEDSSLTLALMKAVKQGQGSVLLTSFELRELILSQLTELMNTNLEASRLMEIYIPLVAENEKAEVMSSTDQANILSLTAQLAQTEDLLYLPNRADNIAEILERAQAALAFAAQNKLSAERLGATFAMAYVAMLSLEQGQVKDQDMRRVLETLVERGVHGRLSQQVNEVAQSQVYLDFAHKWMNVVNQLDLKPEALIRGSIRLCLADSLTSQKELLVQEGLLQATGMWNDFIGKIRQGRLSDVQASIARMFGAS